MLGLLLIMRNRGLDVEYTGLEEHYANKMRRKWIRKYNFDLKRYQFLKMKLEKIQEELRECEKQRFA